MSERVNKCQKSMVINSWVKELIDVYAGNRKKQRINLLIYIYVYTAKSDITAPKRNSFTRISFTSAS